MFNKCSVNKQVCDGYMHVLNLMELSTLFSSFRILIPRVHLPLTPSEAHLTSHTCWIFSCVCSNTSHHNNDVDHTLFLSPFSELRSRDIVAYLMVYSEKVGASNPNPGFLPLKPCVWHSRKRGMHYPPRASLPGFLMAWVRIAPGVFSRMAT